MKSITYIGMDVHKNTYNLCALDGATGEIIRETRCEADASNIKKFIDKLRNDLGNKDMKFETGYEAGCLGYSLYNELKALDIKCTILAPSTMLNSSKGKLNKNDRLDARNIALNLSGGTYKSVYVPDTEDCEAKEYIRMVNDFKTEQKKVKQQIAALVLRMGYRYGGKSKWTAAYMKWLKDIELSEMMREILDEYIAQYELLCDKIERFSARIEEISQKERYKEPVSKLKCFKGIDTTVAMSLQVEISDFSRFPNAKAFSSYLGLTPGEASSGESIRYRSITKQGDALARRLLIESAQALVKGRPGIKGKALKSRQEGQDAKAIAYADKATERLQRKFMRMQYRGMNWNKAITAIARELSCFIWGMETGRIE